MPIYLNRGVSYNLKAANSSTFKLCSVANKSDLIYSVNRKAFCKMITTFFE